MLRSVELAREAAAESADPPLIAASLGSYGAYLADGSEYRGEYDVGVAALADFHQGRLELLSPAVDLLAFETVPSAIEAQAIASLLSTSGPPAWIAFSSLSPGCVADGTPFADAIAPLCALPRVAAIGINCSPSPLIGPAVHAIARATDKAIIAYPNSGEIFEGRGEAWSGEASNPTALVESARQWIDGGVRIVGGCCRTTPAHIGALAALARDGD